jgi:hypothetical protein
MTRSRRAGLSRDEVRRQPLYARMLGLQYLAPSGFLCFVFLEGAIALGILLALAELVSWWGVLVLPVTVALMVKLNDVVAGALTRAAAGTPRATGRGVSADRLYGTGAAAAASIGATGEAGAGAATDRSTRGARTVRLSQAVISRAARAARHDQVPHGRRSPEGRHGVQETQHPAAEPLAPKLPAAELPAAQTFGSRQEGPPESGSAQSWSRESWSPAEPGRWTPADGRDQWSDPSRDQWTPADGGHWTAHDDQHMPLVPEPTTFADDGEALNGPRATWADQLDDQQRARQSAARRYQ